MNVYRTLQRIGTEKEVMKQIALTIAKAGFPIDVNNVTGIAGGDKCVVYSDASIKAPKDSAYSFASIEVKSPAFYYHSDALTAVSKMCQLLNDNYVIDVNESCGFHVHIGNAHQGFPFHTIRSLAAFFWVFEPQLDSLHPAHRVGTYWAGSLRHISPYVLTYERMTPSHKVTPHEGVVEIMKCRNLKELHDMFTVHRSSAYNFTGLDEKGISRNTLEFRQHEGTIDPVKVVNWIEVCHGIVSHMKHLPPFQLFSIIELARLETWEKTGSKKENAELEKKLGPIVADGILTVVDLLRLIDLPNQAKYYETRWKTHELPERYDNRQRKLSIDSWQGSSISDLSDAETVKSIDVVKSLGGGFVTISQTPEAYTVENNGEASGSQSPQDSHIPHSVVKDSAGGWLFPSDSESDSSPEMKKMAELVQRRSEVGEFPFSNDRNADDLFEENEGKDKDKESKEGIEKENDRRSSVD